MFLSLAALTEHKPSSRLMASWIQQRKPPVKKTSQSSIISPGISRKCAASGAAGNPMGYKKGSGSSASRRYTFKIYRFYVLKNLLLVTTFPSSWEIAGIEEISRSGVYWWQSPGKALSGVAGTLILIVEDGGVAQRDPLPTPNGFRNPFFLLLSGPNRRKVWKSLWMPQRK